MDELYSTTSSVYQEPKSVDIENRVFFFLAILAPLFSRETCFLWQWPMGLLFTSPQRAATRYWGNSVAPGVSDSLSRHSCFLVKYFQFARILVLPESLHRFYLGSRFSLEGWRFWASLSKQRWWCSPWREAFWILRHFPLYSPVSVCVGAAWTSHRRDPTVVSTQLFPAPGWTESPCPAYLWERLSAT